MKATPRVVLDRAAPTSSAASAAQPRRFDQLLAKYQRRTLSRANRFFGWLAVIETLALVALALREGGVAPAGGTIAAALVLAAVTLGTARWWPDARCAGCVVAAGQIGFCVTLSHVSDGAAGGVFLFFAAVAFLGLYGDWRVLTTAVAAAAAHYAAGWLWYPAWIGGRSETGFWAGGLYVGFLALESLALIWAARTTEREITDVGRREDQHQALLDELEQRVRERTKHLEVETAERERTSEVLRQNEQRHRNLLATLPIGVFETTRSGRIQFANPHLLGLVGLPSHLDPTFISLTDGRIFPAVDRERLWHRLENQREVRGFGATLRHFDGSTFDVVINARLKTTPPGEELMCEGTVEDVTVRNRAQRDLDILHGQLVLASRQAGMAEVATGVLHNVGNVMTSVNLIVHDVQDRLRNTRLAHLHRVVEVLQREQPRLAEYLSTDQAGRKMTEFLAQLDEHLKGENQQLLTDVEGLVRHFEHIREIIVTQQGSAQLFGVLEVLSPAQLFEDALRLNAESLERHGITLERIFQATASVQADRHKVLQILANLLKNAKDALQVVKPGERSLRVRVAAVDDRLIALSVEDNGPGISRENLTRIFQHGFTTKPTGHGYGLHSSVLAAREMGGDLVATSDGLGKGSTFTLTLPAAKSAAP
jgi:PAS domain S-box-containing protein